jgi:hypothetical protein
MKHPQLHILLQWLQGHPALFSFQENGENLMILEGFSRKSRLLKSQEIERVEERFNSTVQTESYVIVLLTSGKQIVFSAHGFAFPPDFSSTGELPLPNQVYCFQDYQNIFQRLQHVASEEDRKREALELILVLIAILDGAKLVGIEVGREEEQVNEVLSQLEKDIPVPPPHLQ